MGHRALIRSSAAAALDRTLGVESFKASLSAGTAVAADGPMLPSAFAAFNLVAQRESFRAPLRAGTASAGQWAQIAKRYRCVEPVE